MTSAMKLLIGVAAVTALSFVLFALKARTDSQDVLIESGETGQHKAERRQPAGPKEQQVNSAPKTLSGKNPHELRRVADKRGGAGVQEGNGSPLSAVRYTPDGIDELKLGELLGSLVSQDEREVASQDEQLVRALSGELIASQTRIRRMLRERGGTINKIANLQLRKGKLRGGTRPANRQAYPVSISTSYGRFFTWVVEEEHPALVKLRSEMSLETRLFSKRLDNVMNAWRKKRKKE